jgi:hypothetical protein
MKKIHNPLAKRMLALALGLVMVVALFPVTFAFAAETVDPDNTTSSNTLLQLDEKTPAGFNANTTLHPYGNVKERGFLMSEESELYLMQSWNVDKYPDKSLYHNSIYWYDTFQDITGKNGGNLLDINDKRTKYADCGENSPMAYAYLESVAFDPTGTGRKDHIAFVGFRGENQGDDKIVVWVLNTKSGKSSVQWLADASWLHGGIEQYKAANFFSITAGDYNGDGKETLMVYVAGQKVTVQEVKLKYDERSDDPDSPILEVNRDNPSPGAKMLHPLYLEAIDSKTDGSNQNQAWKLSACLASGDLNGDGMDELAVLSYTNSITNGKFESVLYQPYLSVRMGGSGSLQNKWLRQNNGNNTGTTMAAPTIAAGDVDNDGTDELVMAGYYATLNTLGSQCTRTTNNGQNLLTAYLGIDLKNKMENPAFFMISIPENVKKGSSTTDQAYPPVTVECVAINGPSDPEAVFIGGKLFDFSEGDAKEIHSADSVLTGSFDNNDSRSLVQSVAVGNFDGNPVGREQVFFTYGIKNSPSDNDYNYYAVVMGGTAYNDTAAGYGVAKSYFTRSQKLCDDYGDRPNQRLNCLVVAADRDNDGVMARFSKTDYFYSDPEMMAVLQAAPWFSELGGWGDFQGGTSYGYSQSYTFGSSRSKNVSFSVGGILEVDAGGVEADFELGYQLDWSRTFTQSQQTEYSTTFTAGPYDLVLLSRTPVFTYYYDIYDPATGKWIENKMGISIPQNPLIYRLTIDGYNDYVEKYNEQATRYENDQTKYPAGTIPRLKKLEEDPYLHQEGDPFGYRNTDRTNPGITELSDFFTLGTGGGSAEFAFTQEGEQTIETEIAHGFHFHASLVVGAGVKGGAYADLNYTNGTGSFRTTGVSQETSCTVIDLNTADDQPAAANYDFNWKFCTWNVDLSEADGDKNSAVPVYGYLLQNLTAPPAAVTDLEITDYQAPTVIDAAGTYTLRWTDPNTKEENKGRVSNAGFNVYVKKTDGEYTKLNDTLLTTPSYTFQYKGSYSDVFVVTAVSADKNPIESAWSNEVIYFKGANGKSAYEIAVEQGFKGTLEEWLDSLEGSSAYDLAVKNGYKGTLKEWLDSLQGDTGATGQSAYDLAVKNGYKGTLNEWLASLIGATGEKGDTGSRGQDGKDGVGISNVEINDDGYLIVTLTDGSTINAGSVRRAQFDPEDILDLYANSPFTDVLNTFWYADAVDFCYAYGLLKGTSATEFSPNLSVTRGMMVTVLYRLEGAPTVYGTPFSDVAAGQYYTEPVTWAAQSGVVRGYGNGRFAPDDTVTYEQAVTILYRYAQYRHYGMGSPGSLEDYSDAAKASDYALEALAWGEGNGIIVGKTGNILAPGADLKRCELAALLYRFCLYAAN